MARARTLKPGFFANDRLAECDMAARIFFQGLWCHADREGRLEWRPRRLKAEIFPYDDVDAENLAEQLEARGFIQRYDGGDGCVYLQIVKFTKHQNPHHMETPSVIPPPEGAQNKFNHSPISPKQRARIYTRDGHACVLCGSEERLQIDHIVMVAHGGTSEDDNLRTLCSQCNNKRSKSPVKGVDPALSPFPIPDSSSVADATAAPSAAPAKPPVLKPLDLDKAYWDTGKAFLIANGVPPERAGGLLGKWRKAAGREAVVAALARAEAENPSDMVPFIEGCLRAKNGAKHGPATGIAAGFAAALEAREGQRAEDRGACGAAAEPFLDGSRGRAPPRGARG